MAQLSTQMGALHTEVCKGSTSDSTDNPAIGPLISEKQTKTMRKRKWRLECLLSGVKRKFKARPERVRL